MRFLHFLMLFCFLLLVFLLAWYCYQFVDPTAY